MVLNIHSPLCLHGMCKDKFTFLFPPPAGWTIEAVSSSKTFLNLYHTTQQHTSEDANLYHDNIWFVMHPYFSLCSDVTYIMCSVWTLIMLQFLFAAWLQQACKCFKFGCNTTNTPALHWVTWSSDSAHRRGGYWSGSNRCSTETRDCAPVDCGAVCMCWCCHSAVTYFLTLESKSWFNFSSFIK